ncbi:MULTISPECIES: Flp family type IVb pilin [Sphingomonas]|uniref:Flp family type IVb pilin n=1 Tax=Sphingomonas TaxID=13687 RepID=UPI000DEEF18E|nr:MULTISPECIES: Flp family type IVb pilin [Sphingomonas]
MLRKLRRDEDGATAIEYGLIVALIAVACIGAFNALGGGAGGMWDIIKTRVVTAMQPPAS